MDGTIASRIRALPFVLCLSRVHRLDEMVASSLIGNELHKMASQLLSLFRLVMN